MVEQSMCLNLKYKTSVKKANIPFMKFKITVTSYSFKKKWKNREGDYDFSITLLHIKFILWKKCFIRLFLFLFTIRYTIYVLYTFYFYNFVYWHQFNHKNDISHKSIDSFQRFRKVLFTFIKFNLFFSYEWKKNVSQIVHIIRHKRMCKIWRDEREKKMFIAFNIHIFVSKFIQIFSIF